MPTGTLAANEAASTHRSDRRDDFHDEADVRLRLLMAGTQEGNQEACRALLRLSIPWIERVARRVGVPPHAVDDVVQDTLIAMHRGRHHCDASRPILPWLRAIARNKSIDWLRQSRRRLAREIHAPFAVANCRDDSADPTPTPDIVSPEVHASIERLPAGQQRALRLLVFDNLTLDQAAVVSGIKKVALKVSLHRALKALRQRWQGASE